MYVQIVVMGIRRVADIDRVRQDQPTTLSYRPTMGSFGNLGGQKFILKTLTKKPKPPIVRPK